MIRYSILLSGANLKPEELSLPDRLAGLQIKNAGSQRMVAGRPIDGEVEKSGIISFQAYSIASLVQSAKQIIRSAGDDIITDRVVYVVYPGNPQGNWECCETDIELLASIRASLGVTCSNS